MHFAVLSAWVVAALSAGLVIFQLGLAAGAPWGRASYGGQPPRIRPALRVSSAVAALVWPLIALTILRRAGVEVWTPVPDPAVPVVVWVAVAYLAVGVVLNTITRSRIERAIWMPVTTVMFVGTLVVALS